MVVIFLKRTTKLKKIINTLLNMGGIYRNKYGIQVSIKLYEGSITSTTKESVFSRILEIYR